MLACGVLGGCAVLGVTDSGVVRCGGFGAFSIHPLVLLSHHDSEEVASASMGVGDSRGSRDWGIRA